MWAAFGVILLALELVVPGSFIVFFFGLGAIATAVLVGMGVLSSTASTLSIFGVLSLFLLLTLRPLLIKSIGGKKHAPSSDLIGDWVTLTEDISAGASGRGEARGTSWIVLNKGQLNLTKGSKVQINNVSGVSLEV